MDGDVNKVCREFVQVLGSKIKVAEFTEGQSHHSYVAFRDFTPDNLAEKVKAAALDMAFMLQGKGSEFSFVPLAYPEGAQTVAIFTENGVTARTVKSFDIELNEDVIRIDILYHVR
jgi:hypothetical protein